MTLVALHNELHFEIEADLPEVGSYLFVYDVQQACLADYLQDDEAMAKAFAQEEFGVPLEAWQNLNS